MRPFPKLPPPPKLTRLKEKDNQLFLPKKGAREKIVFSKNIKVIEHDLFLNMVKNKTINLFLENDNQLICQFLIKKDKVLYALGLGSYTLTYRKKLLTELLEVQKQVGMELISDIELNNIYKIWDIVKTQLS